MAAIALLALLASSASAAAQGNSHGNAFGHYKSTVSAASSSGGRTIGVSGTGVRNFGSWLDDASVPEVGSGFVNFGFGVWKTPVYREIDAPTIDSGFTVHPRVQVGMSFPYLHAGEPGGPLAEGLGDIYLNAKIQVRAPSEKH